MNNEYYWEVDVYGELIARVPAASRTCSLPDRHTLKACACCADITEISSIDLVLATSPDLPLVLTLTTTYLPDEMVYFGNFTTDYLHGQLEARGYDESALVSNNLYALVREVSPAGAAIAGLVTANAIADFNTTADAPSSGEDFGDAVTSAVVYVTQMQNSTITLFRSGMTEMPGTGTMIIQDMLDGTYSWTMDTESERASIAQHCVHASWLQLLLNGLPRGALSVDALHDCRFGEPQGPAVALLRHAGGSAAAHEPHR